MPVTADSAAIPYGPFAHLSPELGNLPGSTDAASPLSVIRKTLAERDALPVLVVDDAQHLDQSSAATIHGIAFGGLLPIVTTIRAGDPVHGAVTALWKDAGLDRLDLMPLTRADADVLATRLLGGDADVRTLAEIWRMSNGHPLELRELILSAKDAGTLAPVDGLWTLTGDFSATTRIIDLVEDRLSRLDQDERTAAETLAYGEPLDISLLTSAVDPSVVERLERSGVIKTLATGSSTYATLAHPLYGEVLRATLPATRRSTVAMSLAEAATRDGVDSPDPLRVAIWRLEAGAASADELEAAAVDAVRRMAWDLSLRLATASLELAPSYMGHGCAAAALAELGDPDGAEAHLLAARDLVSEPAMLAWNTVSLADVWFYHAGRTDDALELVRKELAQTTDPEIRDEVSSALAINLMMYGNIDEVVELSREVLERSDASSSARFMALVASTSADGLALMPGSVHAGVEAAMPLVEENRHRFANAEDILHAALCVAELAAGDVATARTRVDTRLARAVEIDQGDLPGFWAVFNGLLLLYEGHIARALDAQHEALLLLDRYDSWLSTPLARLGAAHAAAVMADVEQARTHIEAISPELQGMPRLRSRLGHVEAVLTSHVDGVTAGAAAAVVAGDVAADDNHLLWAVEAWHLAARLGAPERVVARLEGVAADRPGTVASLYHRHAAALHTGDPVALEAVVRDFDGSGLRLFAAEAACQVSSLRRRMQEKTLARRAAMLARELLPEGSGARTSPLAELADLVPLTKREREVALLAARGMTSREIAERLFISVRSVDNHLSRVYPKLGVAGRSDLAAVLDPTS